MNRLVKIASNILLLKMTKVDTIQKFLRTDYEN